MPSFLGLLPIVPLVIGISRLLIATSMLREYQRLTRAVAAMVYHEARRRTPRSRGLPA